MAPRLNKTRVEIEKDILQSLKRIRNSLSGIERQSCEYRINMLEKKLVLRQADQLRQLSLEDIVNRDIVEQKISKETKLIQAADRMVALDSRAADTLEPKKRLAGMKIALLTKLKGLCEDSAVREYGVRTNGSVTFDISAVTADPVFGRPYIKFYVDTEQVAHIGTDFTGPLEVHLKGATEMEMLVFNERHALISMIFFPCTYLLKYRKPLEVEFHFQENATIKARVEFHREVGIARRNAEVHCIYKKGHAMAHTSTMNPCICGVCGGMASLQPAGRCEQCNFVCHLRCINLIIFKCRYAQTEEAMVVRKGYNIPHTLQQQKGSGIRFCWHCGWRIVLNEQCARCVVCSMYYHHGRCSESAFPSCGLELEFLKMISNFNTPPSKCLKNSTVATNEANNEKIAIDDFKLLRVLGKGSYGKVMLGHHKESAEDLLAIKILKKQAVINQNNTTYLDLERKILTMVSDFDHPFLMTMAHCFQDAHNVYFATEFLGGGDLYHAMEDVRFGDARIKLYACEILLGIEFLHERGIIYRDLKLDNILIAADGHIKIADFGLCKEGMEAGAVTKTLCGTADTIAPEVILRAGYTKDADWWSYGVVLFEMFEGEEPFPGGATDSETMMLVLQAEIKYTLTPDLPRDLLKKLLVRDPAARLGCGEEDGRAIRAHPYFADVSWDAVLHKRVSPEFVPDCRVEANFDAEYIEEPIVITPSPSMHEYDAFFKNFD